MASGGSGGNAAQSGSGELVNEAADSQSLTPSLDADLDRGTAALVGAESASAPEQGPHKDEVDEGGPVFPSGVLVGHRILRAYGVGTGGCFVLPGPDSTQKDEKHVPSALYIGTVETYRPPKIYEDLQGVKAEETKKEPKGRRKKRGRAKKKPSAAPLDFGLYRVTFDDGDVEDMDPLAVLRCSRLYDEERVKVISRPEKFGRRRKRKDPYIMGRDYDDAKQLVNLESGERELHRHANANVIDESLSALRSLDTEVQGFWEQYQAHHILQGIARPLSLLEGKLGRLDEEKELKRGRRPPVDVDNEKVEINECDKTRDESRHHGYEEGNSDGRCGARGSPKDDESCSQRDDRKTVQTKPCDQGNTEQRQHLLEEQDNGHRNDRKDDETEGGGANTTKQFQQDSATTSYSPAGNFQQPAVDGDSKVSPLDSVSLASSRGAQIDSDQSLYATSLSADACLTPKGPLPAQPNLDCKEAKFYTPSGSLPLKKRLASLRLLPRPENGTSPALYYSCGLPTDNRAAAPDSQGDATSSIISNDDASPFSHCRRPPAQVSPDHISPDTPNTEESKKTSIQQLDETSKQSLTCPKPEKIEDDSNEPSSLCVETKTHCQSQMKSLDDSVRSLPSNDSSSDSSPVQDSSSISKSDPSSACDPSTSPGERDDVLSDSEKSETIEGALRAFNGKREGFEKRISNQHRRKKKPKMFGRAKFPVLPTAKSRPSSSPITTTGIKPLVNKATTSNKEVTMDESNSRNDTEPKPSDDIEPTPSGDTEPTPSDDTESTPSDDTEPKPSSEENAFSSSNLQDQEITATVQEAERAPSEISGTLHGATTPLHTNTTSSTSLSFLAPEAKVMETPQANGLETPRAKGLETPSGRTAGRLNPVTPIRVTDMIGTPSQTDEKTMHAFAELMALKSPRSGMRADHESLSTENKVCKSPGGDGTSNVEGNNKSEVAPNSPQGVPHKSRPPNSVDRKHYSVLSKSYYFGTTGIANCVDEPDLHVVISAVAGRGESANKNLDQGSKPSSALSQSLHSSSCATRSDYCYESISKKDELVSSLPNMPQLANSLAMKFGLSDMWTLKIDLVVSVAGQRGYVSSLGIPSYRALSIVAGVPSEKRPPQIDDRATVGVLQNQEIVEIVRGPYRGQRGFIRKESNGKRIVTVIENGRDTEAEVCTDDFRRLSIRELLQGPVSTGSSAPQAGFHSNQGIGKSMGLDALMRSPAPLTPRGRSNSEDFLADMDHILNDELHDIDATQASMMHMSPHAGKNALGLCQEALLALKATPGRRQFGPRVSATSPYDAPESKRKPKRKKASSIPDDFSEEASGEGGATKKRKLKRGPKKRGRKPRANEENVDTTSRPDDGASGPMKKRRKKSKSQSKGEPKSSSNSTVSAAASGPTSFSTPLEEKRSIEKKKPRAKKKKVERANIDPPKVVEIEPEPSKVDMIPARKVDPLPPNIPGKVSDDSEDEQHDGKDKKSKQRLNRRKSKPVLDVTARKKAVDELDEVLRQREEMAAKGESTQKLSNQNGRKATGDTSVETWGRLAYMSVVELRKVLVEVGCATARKNKVQLLLQLSEVYDSVGKEWRISAN